MSKESSHKRYGLIVFDWEGTLGDTVGQSLCRIAVEAGKHALGADGLSESLFRQNLYQATRVYFPSWSDGQIEQYCSRKCLSNQATLPEVCVFPGAKDLVERLSQAGIHLAIASNKGAQSLQSALQRAGMQPFFSVTRAAGQAPPKPCPQMLEEILDEFLMSAKEALMIGDSVSEMEMAKQIGMDAVGFDFYHQNTEALLDAGASLVFDNYEALAQFLSLPEKGL